MRSRRVLASFCLLILFLASASGRKRPGQAERRSRSRRIPTILLPSRKC